MPTAGNAINDLMTYECNRCGVVMTYEANHCDGCKKILFPNSSAIQSTIKKAPRPPQSCRKGVGCRRKGCQLIHVCRYAERCRSLQPGSKFKCIYGHNLVFAHLAMYGPEGTAHMLKRGHL